MESRSKNSLRVLVVDDDPIVRRGLQLILRSEPGVVVVGEAGDGEEAVAQAGKLEPDLVLMDLRMPKLDGLGATQRLKAANPDLRVVILSVYADQIEAALAAGATGFLLKDSPVDRLLEVVHATSPVRDAKHRRSHVPAARSEEE